MISLFLYILYSVLIPNKNNAALKMLNEDIQYFNFYLCRKN